mmetsp:Transcript_34460/g.74477  ORF Transcript_34460/g.74477 Transcript_34460/m.74477 type:complete len:338 (-) Transcript_34460:37-1050(-)
MQRFQSSEEFVGAGSSLSRNYLYGGKVGCRDDGADGMVLTHASGDSISEYLGSLVVVAFESTVETKSVEGNSRTVRILRFGFTTDSDDVLQRCGLRLTSFLPKVESGGTVGYFPVDDIVFDSVATDLKKFFDCFAACNGARSKTAVQVRLKLAFSGLDEAWLHVADNLGTGEMRYIDKGDAKLLVKGPELVEATGEGANAKRRLDVNDVFRVRDGLRSAFFGFEDHGTDPWLPAGLFQSEGMRRPRLFGQQNRARPGRVVDDMQQEPQPLGRLCGQGLLLGVELCRSHDGKLVAILFALLRCVLQLLVCDMRLCLHLDWCFRIRLSLVATELRVGRL